MQHDLSRLRREWDHLIASELRALSAQIDALGAILCDDLAVVSAHGETLQQIDRIAQEQRCLADLVDATCRNHAVSGLTLDNLAARLARAAVASDVGCAVPAAQEVRP